MLKRYLLAVFVGSLLPIGLALYLGPDVIIQTGMKLAAVQTSYDWQATPREAVPVTYETRELMVPVPAKKVARR